MIKLYVKNETGKKGSFFSIFRVFQVVNKKCTEKQTAEMIRHTAVNTDQRKRNIGEQVNLMNYNGSATLAAFGIKLDDKNFLKVLARQLPPPKIAYSNGPITPSKGQWNMGNFLNSAVCLKWCILNTDSYLDPSKLNAFIRQVCTKALICWKSRQTKHILFCIFDFNFSYIALAKQVG